MATCFAPLHVVVHRAGLPRHQSAAGESRKGGRQRRVFKSCQEIHPQPVILLLHVHRSYLGGCGVTDGRYSDGAGLRDYPVFALGLG